MSIRTFLTVATLACASVVSDQVSAQTMGLQPGSHVKDALVVGEGQARVTIPLPGGEWRVFRAVEQEMRMLNPIYQHMAPARLDLFLTQRIGSRIGMTIRIEASKNVAPNTITSLSVDDPCKRTDTLYRNAYDSGGTVVNCLLINHIVGYLRPAGTGLFPDLRNWMSKEGLEIPTTALTATFAQSLPTRFLIVTVTANPALRDLDSAETNWTFNPFHRDRVAMDPLRNQYAKDFFAWSEMYKTRIPISQRSGSDAAMSGSGTQVPAFPSNDDSRFNEARKQAAEEARKATAAEEARKRAAAEEDSKRAAVANPRQVDFNAEAHKAARILGCQPAEVKVVGAEGGNVQYQVTCAGSELLLLSCDSSGLCLQKKSTTSSKQ